MTAEAGKIYEQIPKIMADFGAIAKTRSAGNQYKFRGVDDFLNVAHPLLVKYGVFIVPVVLDRSIGEMETKQGDAWRVVWLRVQRTFYASDGSSIVCVTEGEGSDKGDKATNKAMSASLKYALIEVFCVPTEDMNDSGGGDTSDSEDDSPERVSRTQPPPQKARQPGASSAYTGAKESAENRTEIVGPLVEYAKSKGKHEAWLRLHANKQFGATTLGALTADQAEKLKVLVDETADK